MKRRSLRSFGTGHSARFRAQSAVLLLLLGASAALAWQSYAEHQSFAAHARRSAQQTASEAAGSLVRLANAIELNLLLRVFAPVSARAHDDTPDAQARFAQLATHPATPQWCSMLDRPCYRGPARYVFHLQLQTGAWTATASVDSSVRRWIRDSVSYEATHAYRSGWQLAALDARIDGVSHVVAYRVGFDDRGVPVIANGLEIDIGPAARQAFAGAFASTPLLTIPATQRIPNDSLFVVDVVDARRSVLFHGGVGAAAPEATIRGEPTWDFGTYDVRLGLTPRLRSALDQAAGGPRNVVPTYALFLLCAGLVMLGVLQVRREAALARMRETFIGNVSHELRTPLAQIRLHAEALQFGFIRGEVARDNALGVITSESIRLKHLVDNVLAYSRDGSGELAVALVPVDVAAVLDDVVRRLAPIAMRAGMQLEVVVDGAPLATADRVALEQVIANLVDNAIRYATGSEQITLRGARVGNTVRIAVEDAGPGISPRDRARIWDRFVRLDSATDVAGTGIGLSIVASLVSAMRGRATVTAVEPHGASFVIELPAA